MTFENPYTFVDVSQEKVEGLVIGVHNIEQIILSLRYQQAKRVPYTVVVETAQKLLNEQSGTKNT